MPLYVIRCQSGHKFERVIPLAQFDDPISCECGAQATRIICAPMFQVDNVGYSCPITGDWISSKKDHENNLQKHGCRVLEGGEHEAAAKFRADGDLAIDKSVDEQVEKSWESMPGEKRERLANELEFGMDAQITRGSPNA